MAKLDVNKELGISRGSAWNLDWKLLRLNVGDVAAGIPQNLRDDFGGNFPVELAIRVCDLSQELDGAAADEIRAILSAQDSTDDTTMAWLVKSVIKHGVQNQIVGIWNPAKSEAIATDGNRRTTAVYIANRVFGAAVHAVPFKSESSKSAATIVVRQLVSNRGSKKFSDIENGKSFQFLQDMEKWEIPQIAEETGFSERYIKDCLDALALPAEHQKLAEQVELPASTIAVAVKAAEGIAPHPLAVGTEAAKILDTAFQEAQAEGKGKPSGALVRRITKAAQSEAQASAPDGAEQDREQRQRAEENIEAVLPMVASQKALYKAAAALLDEGLDADTLRSMVAMLSAASSASSEGLMKAAKILGRAI